MKERAVHIIATLCLHAAAAGLGGCIVVPVPLPDKESPLFVTEEDLVGLAPGETTRQDVRSILGDPLVAFGDGRIWLYGVQEAETGRWGVCGFLIIPPFPGNCGILSDGEETELLRFDFDREGRVSGWQSDAIRAGECTNSGICLRDNNYSVYAPEAIDVTAKRFEVSDDSCAVYFYNTTAAADMARPAYLVIDGRTRGGLLDEHVYLRVDIAPGEHGIGGPYSLKRDMIEYRCSGGEALYVEFAFPGVVEFGNVTVVPAGEGKAAVFARRRVLGPDPMPPLSPAAQ